MNSLFYLSINRNYKFLRRGVKIMSITGVDVSKWQGNIDWGKVKNAGVNFAIIREGYGKESPNQVDKKFEINYQGAKSAGIFVGAYHYSYADSADDAKREAEFCLKNISGKQFEYPICFDIEDRTLLALSNRQRTDICKAFCESLESAGYYAMIYCNLNWYNNYLISDELKRFDLWLAQWGVPSPGISCGIWQKSDAGSFDGINTSVDVDISYRNYPEIIREKGLNGYSKTDSCILYTVKQGDTLWGIAKKYLGSGIRYKEIKAKNFLSSDNIYPGQVLRIDV